jgi:hypothetical protein
MKSTVFSPALNSLLLFRAAMKYPLPSRLRAEGRRQRERFST